MSAELMTAANRDGSNDENVMQRAFRAAGSIILERLQWLKQAGVTFKGQRDTYDIFGYDRVISDKQYRDRFARGGLARRIVEVMPKATWRGGCDLVEDEDPKVSTEFERQWAALADRLDLYATFQKADILSQLSNYAVILIGAPGELDQELEKGMGPDNVWFLKVFSGGGGPGAMQNASRQMVAVDAECTIESLVTDPADKRFGFPAYYKLQRADLLENQLQKRIHWSRIIHVAEGCLSDDIYGTPCLESVWNLLDDLDKITGGGAEAFFQRANQGLHVDIDKDLKFLPAEAETLNTKVEEYKHNITRVLRTRGTKITPLGSDTANFAQQADAVITQIAGTKSIPKRVLTGSEMGELASSQDRENFKDQVNGRQTGYAGPYIVKRFSSRMIEYGYLPTPKTYEVKWPHIQVLTEQEKADGAAKWAEVNRTAGITVFTAEEIRDHWYGMEPAEESDTEGWRADLAIKMATVNKTQGLTVFSPDEIRMLCYNKAPLPIEEQVPVGAPERISVDAPPADGDANAPLDTPVVPKVLSENKELLVVLAEAIRNNQMDIVNDLMETLKRKAA